MHIDKLEKKLLLHVLYNKVCYRKKADDILFDNNYEFIDSDENCLNEIKSTSMLLYCDFTFESYVINKKRFLFNLNNILSNHSLNNATKIFHNIYIVSIAKRGFFITIGINSYILSKNSCLKYFKNIYKRFFNSEELRLTSSFKKCIQLYKSRHYLKGIYRKLVLSERKSFFIKKNYRKRRVNTRLKKKIIKRKRKIYIYLNYINIKKRSKVLIKKFAYGKNYSTYKALIYLSLHLVKRNISSHVKLCAQKKKKN